MTREWRRAKARAEGTILAARENLILVADLLHLGKREGRRRAGEWIERLELAEAELQGRERSALSPPSSSHRPT